MTAERAETGTADSATGTPNDGAVLDPIEAFFEVQDRLSSAEGRLTTSDIKLPPAPQPLGAYMPAVGTGNLLFVSGMLPLLDGEPQFVGRVGKELTTEQGRRAAYAAALNVLSVARQHLGSLDRVSRVVRLGVYIATGADFTDHAKVADGASEVLQHIFGDEAMCSRSVFGVRNLPLGMSVELEVTLEVSGANRASQSGVNLSA